MTEDNLLPSEEKTALLEKVKRHLTKKVILALSALLLIGVGSVTFTSIQASAKFDAFVSEVDTLIGKDALNEANSSLNESKTEYGEKQEYKRLLATVNELIKSKQDFSTAEKYFSESRYVEAISYYKRVKDSDNSRKSNSISRIEESAKLAIAAAIESAKNLLGKKEYVDALSALTEVNSLAGDSTEFQSLKSEIQPLAADQVKREEAAANARYISALRGMRVQKDSFNGITFYTDRTTPYYADNSKFFLYIGKREGSEPYLRMEVRYSDDDWLFVEQAEIKIDGSVYDFELSSSDWKTDNGSGDIWEWADVPATEYHLSIIDKVIKSRSAVIRFTGSKYYDDRTISSTQKRAFVNVLNAYEALKRGLNK